MTNEQKRIACAEGLGWKRWLTSGGKVYLRNPDIKTAEYWKFVGCKITDKEITEPLNDTKVPNPESSLNDCKPLIEMAIANKLNFSLDTVFETRWRAKFTFALTYDYIALAPTPESAIVEAFLKWRGRL